MTGLVNDALRSVIAWAIRLLGVVLDIRQGLRILRFATNQRRLRRKYRIHSDTPVLSYGPRVVEAIRHVAAHAAPDTQFALTSGSTGEPKKLLYTKHRLRKLKFTFSDMFIRACRAYGLQRTSVYVFSSFHRDSSLTSLLLNEAKLPSYFSTLQAPYRVQQHDSIRALVSEYGATAVRLWILTIANPGVLYATNPSTISAFFDELKTNWSMCSKLVNDWHSHPQRFDRAVRKIARRLDSRGSAERVRLIATSPTPVPLKHFAPAARAYICWTGGYVKPFLDRLANHLPASRYRLIPMYSMSTETVETETVFRNSGVHFLPLASGVVYEFIKACADDEPENVLRPDQLKPGESYAMVVSDGYGLRRYQTGDLFACRGIVNGLPDLAFLRRRALEYSFVGEKVTAKQLAEVFETLRELLPEGFLTCVPSLPVSGLPHYQICFVSSEHGFDAQNDAQNLASDCDELLGALNCEYKHKRASGILGPMTFIQTDAAEFAQRFGATWETQFKFLPLYQRTWESVEPRPPIDVPHLNASHLNLSHKNTARPIQTTSLQ